MSVDPTAFVDRMSLRWVEFGNAVSPALKLVWRQLALTFNGMLDAYGTPAWRTWHALRPETGTGKTQGMCLYAAMLSRHDHPGMLIVVRLKEQANEITATVNAIAGDTIAKAHHSDNRLTQADAATTPVLVITHEAFKRGLAAENQDGDTYNWKVFTGWGDGSRKLVVIDEELDLLVESQVTLSDVLDAKRAVLTLFPNDYPEQLGVLDKLEDEMRRIERERQDNKSEHVLWAGWPDVAHVQMAPLVDALAKAPLAALAPSAPREALEHLQGVLVSIELTVKQWCWQSRKAAGKGVPAVIALNSARLITDSMPCGAVVLDATADVDVSYQLFGDQMQVKGRPANARKYDNVTLHLSRGWSMGKHSRLQTKEQDVSQLLGHLNETLGADRKVLIVTHLDIEPAFKAHEVRFHFDVAHWNALDGRNDWRDYDAIVIFTLPYRPTEWAPNLYMATRGPQQTTWLQSKEQRGFGTHRDIRSALNTGKLATQVIQAINRVRCRRVTNAEGDCATTDVYMLVPTHGGEALVSKIQQAMPGIQSVPWSTLRKSQAKSRPSKWRDSLLHVARRLKPGTQLFGGSLKAELGGIPVSAWERLTRDLDSGRLDTDLKAAGAIYAKRLTGKRPVRGLVKC